MAWKKGDRVRIYTNLGKGAKGTVQRPPPVSIKGQELSEYMRVLQDDGLSVHVKASLCKKLVRKQNV